MFLLRKLFKLLLHGDSKPEPFQSAKEIALDLVLVDQTGETRQRVPSRNGGSSDCRKS